MPYLTNYLGYPVFLTLGFVLLRFTLALTISPLERYLPLNALHYIFWGIQGSALLAAVYWLYKKGNRAGAVITAILAILSLGIGPMD